MKIENPQELEKLIKLMRKTGVESLKIGDLELKLTPDEPPSKYKQRQSNSGPDPMLEMSPDEKRAYEEKLLFWSSTPPGMEGTN